MEKEEEKKFLQKHFYTLYDERSNPNLLFSSWNCISFGRKEYKETDNERISFLTLEMSSQQNDRVNKVDGTDGNENSRINSWVIA